MPVTGTPTTPVVVTTDQIRMFLRDKAENNILLDQVQFSQKEVDFAVEMEEIVDRFSSETGYELALRAGVDTGTVSSGLVGRTAVIYDLWGAAVNLAYQAQSGSSQPGIYVTTTVYEALRESQRFTSAGEVTVGSPPNVTTEPIWRLAERP